MRKALKALVASVGVFGLIAVSAPLADAQQADDNDAGMQILFRRRQSPQNIT